MNANDLLSPFSAAYGWLADHSMGPPGPDGHWPTWLTVLFHSDNLVIGVGQIAIPIIVAIQWKYRRDGVSPRELWSALAFVPLTAMSRFARVLEIGGPIYHFTVLWDTMVAAGTIVSVARMPRFVRHILRLPSRAELHDALNVAQNERVAKELAFARVLVELDAARTVIKDEVWKHETTLALDAIERATALLKEEGAIRGH